jgi:hypothetical protein
LPDFSDGLRSIDVRTLLIWGDDDKRSPLSAVSEPVRVFAVRAA